MSSKTACPAAAHLSHGVGHFLPQVLQELLPDYVGTDLLGGLVGQDLTVVLPGSGLGLHHQVPLRDTGRTTLYLHGALACSRKLLGHRVGR